MHTRHASSVPFTWGRSRHAAIARERTSDYRTSTSQDDAAELEGLAAAVGRLRDRSIDELSEDELEAELAVVERVVRQLSARQARLVTALASRRRRRARDAARAAGRGEHVAAERASRELDRQLADRLGWAPGQAKRARQLGRQLEPGDRAGSAFDAGQLSTRHATVLADTLGHLIGPVRDRAEAELLPLATTQDPVEFGRTCRRLLARTDAQAAEQADARRRARRSARLWQHEDGTTGLSARLSGLDAETVTTAMHAFRRPDARDEHRSPEQAGADALVAIARAALDAGVAPADRGVAPHVQVALDWSQLIDDCRGGEGRHTGPLPAGEIRRLLADCGVSRLLVDPAGIAIEAGAMTRNVAIGIYRAIAARDRTCIAHGCDIPAHWCQVMHLDVPYRLQGRLTIDTAAMGCAHHHFAFDQLGWVITWHGRRPILHHPDHPPPSPSQPDGPPRPGPGPDPGSGSGVGPGAAVGPSPGDQLPLLEPP